MKKIFFCLLLLYLSSCSKSLFKPITLKKSNLSKNLRISELKNWQQLDIEKDSVLGISLNRTYKEIIKHKKGVAVTVAVIDSYIHSKHEDLQNSIWVNKKEIPNNNIDDDQNGFIDDIHGWNFLGNNQGDCTFRLNYDYSRKLRLLLKNNVDTLNFKGNKKDSIQFAEIVKAFKKSKKKNLSKLEDAKYYQLKYVDAFKAVNLVFKNKPYNLFQVDSLYRKYDRKNDEELFYDIYFVRDHLKTNNNKAWIDLFEERAVGEKLTSLNPKFNENKIIKDDETNLNDLNYGNGKVDYFSNKTWHGTMMSGMIAAQRNNNLGIDGFGNQIKIMPLVVSAASGNHRDKDIANAIRYAVDNGAKVINMSFGKSSPVYPEWIRESLEYASQKDVLIVVSAGNSSENLDSAFQYPNDYIKQDDTKEFINNLIVVGGTSHNLNSNLLYTFTNYGTKNVDVYSPSVDIWCLDPLRNYILDDGTSFGAAITSGLAALIRSHYPKLTAEVVKKIIMDSAIKLDLMVQVPGEKEGVLKPFSELSKSGGVVNAYNAMLMAKEKNKRIKQSNVCKKN
ncbi:Cell wall-associated protease precursor [Flavobacterium columnare]|uniref:S8 family serine peptidase n=2 Tax=Flavobacterium TaxID=237 RepID=A0ABW8PKQ7_9FLAO|nr:S8 family serine peptidase [Flavobacterium columnare]SPE77929.1 Cell wall-associated protease precursor [Flavobacterium columnare]